MISRREYFSIVLTMLAVFLLFMGTQIGKEIWEREDASGRPVDTGLRSDQVWTAPAKGSHPVRNISGVVYLGDKGSPGADAYVQWALYAKRTLVFASSPEDKACSGAELLLVPGEELEKNTDALKALMDNGVNILCLSLPSPDKIKGNKELRELLGIRSVRRSSIRLSGMHLFGGFLLGGERIYRPETKKEARERQDLPLETPWYIVRAGTETYMRGILREADEKEAEAAELKNEDMPAIIWRHHLGSGELFAVNGGFMKDGEIAGGIVQAALSKIETTSVYPVVDAQVFSMLDFPSLSDENSEALLPVYGRGMTDISKNIILPSLVYLPNRYGIAITSFAAMQFDYGDDQEPEEELTEQFRKEIHALHGEFALSARSRGGIPIEKQLAADAAVLSGGEESVDVSSVWTEPENLKELAASDTSVLPSLHTVVTLPEKGKAPLDYLRRDVTVQRVTGDAVTHTYMQDIKLLCRETSMGYDSCYCDFSSVWWPRTDADHWQKYSDKVLSNLITYRRPFEAFDRVTASVCDAKLRRYLMIDYDYSRNGSEIEITLPLLLTEASFVLRLNDETVAEMQGGSFTRIEDDAYILRADSSYVRLRVEPSEPLSELSE